MNGKDIRNCRSKMFKEGNKELCARYQINGYPSIKLITR